MAGTEGGHGGGHDLLKQATQAMMSRCAWLYFCGLSHFQFFTHIHAPIQELLDLEYSLSKVVNDIDHSCFKSSVFSEFAHALIAHPDFQRATTFRTLIGIENARLAEKVNTSTQLLGAQITPFPLCVSENFSSHISNSNYSKIWLLLTTVT
jgi:hypothetical protein